MTLWKVSVWLTAKNATEAGRELERMVSDTDWVAAEVARADEDELRAKEAA